MKILVLGATGATGKLVVQQLINRNVNLKIIVRSIDRINSEVRKNSLVECIIGNILGFNKEDAENLVEDCDGLICCLGHNLTLKGIFGRPRRLVVDSLLLIYEAIEKSKKNNFKVILMSSTAIRNRKIKERYGAAERVILLLLGILLPPHRDNEKAAGYLTKHIGTNNSQIEWCAVRPDALFNEEKESEYQIFESPLRSPVFNAGKTSRINVSLFMTELIFNNVLWEKWKYKMPVIYNKYEE